MSAMSRPMPWKVSAKGILTVPSPRKPRKPKVATIPEWVLQASMIAEFHQCQDEGYKFRVAGDMNAGKRSRRAAAQAKAMGLNPGETDIRLYGTGARLLLIEVKTVNGKTSDNQDKAHDEFAELGFQVLIVAPVDEQDARAKARAIANKFADPAGVLL